MAATQSNANTSQPVIPQAPLRVSVIGTGALGKEHVRVYSELAAQGAIQLAGIYDAAADTARKIAEKYKVPVFPSIAAARAASDAVSIVTPTVTHFELASLFLNRGVHVLLEKPMTANTAEAAELIHIARNQ